MLPIKLRIKENLGPSSAEKGKCTRCMLYVILWCFRLRWTIIYGYLRLYLLYHSSSSYLRAHKPRICNILRLKYIRKLSHSLSGQKNKVGNQGVTEDQGYNIGDQISILILYQSGKGRTWHQEPSENVNTT